VAPTHSLFQQPWPTGEFRFFQMGFVVDDIVAAATRWTRVFGVGPFQVMPRRRTECVYRGSAGVLDVQIAVAQAGPVQIELIHDLGDTPNVISEIFPKGDAGFHQVCTVTPDFDATAAHYASLGYEQSCFIEMPNMRVAFYDTYADFGFYTEVAEQSPSFLANLAAVAETCKNWDGTDPVRIVTRDGYTVP